MVCMDINIFVIFNLMKNIHERLLTSMLAASHGLVRAVSA